MKLIDSEELISHLECVEDWIEGVSGGYPYTEEEELMLASLDKAIDVIKMQVAIKPDCKMVESDGIWADYYCPRCKGIVSLNEHHCKCGQRLEW